MNITDMLNMSAKELISFAGVVALLIYMYWQKSREVIELLAELKEERDYSRDLTNTIHENQLSTLETMSSLKHVIEAYIKSGS